MPHVQNAVVYLYEYWQEDWAMQKDADKLRLLLQAKDNMERRWGDCSHAAGGQWTEVTAK